MNKKIIRISLLSIMIFSLIVGCNKSKFNDNTNSNEINEFRKENECVFWSWA